MVKLPKIVHVLDGTFDCICITDICLTFITGYAIDHTKEVVLNRRNITTNYLLSIYFILDVLSSIPTELILIVVWTIGWDTASLMKYVQLANLLKVIRTRTLMIYMGRTAELRRRLCESNSNLRKIFNQSLYPQTVLFLQLFFRLHTSNIKYHSIMNQVRQYMRHKQLPLPMQRRLLDYYEYRFRETYFRENTIFPTISERLRKDMNTYICMNLIKCVPILKDLPPLVRANIVPCLRPEVFLPNDIIIKAGTMGDCMYFIYSGTVAVYTPTGKEVCHLQDGGYFGEMSLIAKDSKRIANVVAIETTEVYRLERKHFNGYLKTLPELKIFNRNLHPQTVIFLQLFFRLHTSNIKYNSIMNQLKQYMRHKQVPIPMQKRLLDYYKYRFRETYFRENTIFPTISERLRKDMNTYICMNLIKCVPILKDLPPLFRANIVPCLRPEVFLPNDIIIKAGTMGDCMYFIYSGTVAVYTPTGKEVCHLQDGGYFGEMSLIAKDSKRIANVVAIETTEVYRLERKHFNGYLKTLPELYKKLERVAESRRENTLVMEEIHRKHILEKTMRMIDDR
ncbi:i[[h]] channel isoform e [Holotrichia oblita]|uniref:I[[h]] channel isoform e n=1 Tax=Holotrichia oblita TaxID=644536 RepID=A0ACB9SKK7_HOLOL|nr:i[[h]] channel isoform e [Holotrichia oblita]